MRKYLFHCATIALTLASTAALATEVIDSSGEENFIRYCAACHGSSGRGDGPVATAIAKPIPDLTLIAARRDGKFPRQIIKNAIDGRWRIDAHGTQQMPVWGYEFWIGEGAGDFSETRVNQILDGLIDYLESIQGE
jgi:mono/diheme cytochrome c family protein